MVLTRMKLDLSKRDAMRALVAPNLLHGAIEQACAGDHGRKLWRIDTLKGEKYLLLLSEAPPELTQAQAQFGAEPWETLSYQPPLDRVQDGTRCHFRLTANPTVSRANKQGNRGSVLAHVTPEHQMRWLSERAEQHGFSLQPDTFFVVSSEWRRFQKHGVGCPVSLLAVTYEGVLEVTDAERFREALTCGIGRAKAYGMGMMTVMRYE